jgi:hypothetical protein
MLIKKADIPDYNSSIARINDGIVYLTDNSILLGRTSTKHKELIGVKITSIKIQEITKNDIQIADINEVERYYSNWVDGIKKYIILIINNKYKIIWAAYSKDTRLRLPEELQQYLK